MVEKEITVFYESAKKLCEYFNYTVIKQDNIEELMLLMLDVYSKGLLLPEVEPDDMELPVREDRQPIIKIEIPSTYWEIFDPFIEDEPVCGDLADDLSDIRDDLLDGIADYENGLINNAVFNWKLFHRSHYGNHIVAAIKALQHLREEN